MSLELAGVSYKYSPDTPYERLALKNINLKIMPGEFVGIIGHTGSGKSTLVQHLNGLLTPTEGRIFIDGVDIGGKTPEAKGTRRKVGMVFQYPEHQLFAETVYADVAFGPRNAGADEAEVEARVRYGMCFAGLNYEEFKDRSPFTLSGGQMRRAAIAGVIALQPPYLILDEPTAGLDPRGRDEILAGIRRLYRESRLTVVLVSHNMAEVVRMAKRIIVMHGGGILFDGPPGAVFAQDQQLLEQAGIRLPAISRLMRVLAGKGKPVKPNVLTVDEAVKEILPWARGR